MLRKCCELNQPCERIKTKIDMIVLIDFFDNCDKLVLLKVDFLDKKNGLVGEDRFDHANHGRFLEPV